MMSRLSDYSCDATGIANLKKQERHFFQTHNLPALLGCYLEQFNYFFNDLKFIQAMTTLHHAEQLMDELQLPEYKLRFVKLLGMAVTYNYKVEETKARIERDIPYAKMQKDDELLGVYYQILSYLYLKEKNYQRAIDYAKMAYFFVADKELEDYYSLCNAQLQLVISLLDGRYVTEAASYIEYYKWRLEYCQTAGEKVLVSVIGATLAIHQGEVEQGLLTYQKMLPLFEKPETVLYATYLSEHIQTQLQFITGNAYLSIVDVVSAQLKKSVLRYQWAYPLTSRSDNDATMQSAYPLQHFLWEGQGFFDQTNEEEFLYCTHIQVMNREDINQVDWLHFMMIIKDKLEEEITRQVGNQYIFAQLHENTLMIVTRYPHVEEEILINWCNSLIQKVMKEIPFELQTNAIMVTLGDSRQMETSDFFALYSQTVAKIYNNFDDIG